MALVAQLTDKRETVLSGPAQLSEVGDSPSHELPAWMLSMTLHASLVLALGFLMPTPAGVVTERDRTAGIALVSRNELREPSSPFAKPSSSSLSQPTAAATAALPSSSELTIDAAYNLPTQDQTASAAATEGLESPGVQGLLLDNQPTGRAIGQGAKTQVFGAEGTGSKFVYVFDRSASMQGFQGRPMVAAKTELINSLRDLASVHQFQIVFYNERISVFRPLASQTPRMMFGSDENKRLAEQYVRSIIPIGATRHMRALELAIGMQPDVIFLLTDAAEPRLSNRELTELRRRNGGVTAIHTIEFGAGPDPGGHNFLAELARQNRGQHVYVDISRLP